MHLYFSAAPLPNDVELSQVEGLRAFKAEVQQRGLYGEYANPTELTVKVWQSIEHDIAGMDVFPAPATPAAPATGVSWLVQPGQEAWVSYSTKGVPKNRTRRWLDVTNQSATKDAEAVRFSMNEEEAGVFLNAPDEPTTVHAGQTRRLGMDYTLGGGGAPKLTIEWLEDGVSHERTFHI